MMGSGWLNFQRNLLAIRAQQELIWARLIIDNISEFPTKNEAPLHIV
jgi:hypothetical protein